MTGHKPGMFLNFKLQCTMSTVLTFGTFDIFHPGHEYYLRESKKYGDRLVTIVARDETVKNLKGRLPRYNEEQRRKTVEEQDIADNVALGELENYYACIVKYKPQTICLGYDQWHLADGLERFLTTESMKINVIRIPPFKPNIYKSSKL